MKTLHINKNYRIETETGYQEIESSSAGNTAFTVNNYDENGKFLFKSHLTFREILHAHKDATGEVFDLVELDEE